ncbi:MAG TPA: glycosyltransferase family 4 protein [Pyrinomonadaceae bacterium]|nr:glycosyltransferase family 4 protein [Pyrinomonadaceae bacterium]
MKNTTQPRLAYLISRYPAISHTFVLREVRQLRAQGFDIRVASINSPDRSDEGLTAEEREESASTFYVKQDGAGGAIRAHVRTLFSNPVPYFRGLWFALRLGGFDIKRVFYGLLYFVEAVMMGQWMKRKGLSHLHVHFATPASTVGLVTAQIFPVTLSITVHGPDEFYDVSAYSLAEKIRGSSFICCIGNYARSQLMKLSSFTEWSKFEVSPLGVDAEIFAPRPAPCSGAAPFEVICVGRLVPAKGQHILVAAIDRLVKAGHDIRLRFVGDGPDRETLESMVSARNLGANVIFEGAVNQDRIRALYARADVFALASFAEGIPVVLMEAMAMEIPCVTTFITGIPELINDGESGLLVAPSDDVALAAAITRLIEQPALRANIGRNGRLAVVEKYNLGKNTERLAEIFQRRLNGFAKESL